MANDGKAGQRGRRRIIAALLGAAAGVPLGVRAQAAEGEKDALAAQVLEKADQIRFPSESFEVDVAVTSFSEDKQTDARLYKVLSRGNENTIVQGRAARSLMLSRAPPAMCASTPSKTGRPRSSELNP